MLRTVPNAPMLIEELVAMQKEETHTSDSITIPLHLLNHLSVIVLAIDLDTFEILYNNDYAEKLFGDIRGTKCWRTLQRGQSGPCPFCSNPKLMDQCNSISPTHHRELQNTLTHRWYAITETAVRGKNGRLIKIQVAEDITKERQQREKELEALRGFTDSLVEPTDMITMCCNCHKIRDAKGKWIHPAVYIHHQTECLVSHGLCALCARELYPEIEL